MAIPSSNRNFIQKNIKVDNASHSDTAASATTAISASIANTAVTASYALTFAGTITNAISASYAATASLLLGSVVSASYALTASYAMNGGGSTTGSFTGSFTGSLFGTSSWAQSASQALTASYIVTAQTASYIDAGNITTGTLNNNRLPSQINVTGVTASFTGSLQGTLIGTSSWATNTITASYALSSSIALTASFYGGSVTSASYALNSTSASLAQTASFYGGNVTSASYAISSSYSERTDKINVIINSSSTTFYPVFVDDAGNKIPYLDGDFTYVPSTNQLAVGGITSSLFGTSSWATNATTASYVLNSISSSFASTSSFVNTLTQNVIITGSLTVTGSSEAWTGPPHNYKISGQWYSQAENATAYGTAAHATGSGTTNSIYMVPWIITRTQTFTSGAIENTFSNSLLNARFGLYRANPTSSLPQTLVYDSGDINLSGATVKTVSFASPITLTPGLYYTAFTVSGSSPTSTMRSLGVSAFATVIGLTTPGGASNGSYINATRPWAVANANMAFPSDPSTLTFNYTTGAIYATWFRLQ